VHLRRRFALAHVTTTLLPLVLITSILWGQQAASTTRPSRFFSVAPLVIFPTLTYGPDSWSLLRLQNPAAVSKVAKIVAYRSDGEPMLTNSLYTLKPGETIDIRIGVQSSSSERCWARVEDMSSRRSKPSLRVSAGEEHLNGDVLEDYQQTTASPRLVRRWLNSARAVSGRNVLFLNVSDKPTIISVCSTFSSPDCDRTGTTRIGVNAKQMVVLSVRKIGRPYLLIKPIAPGECDCRSPSSRVRDEAGLFGGVVNRVRRSTTLIRELFNLRLL